jgi:hypothetical protein
VPPRRRAFLNVKFCAAMSSKSPPALSGQSANTAQVSLYNKHPGVRFR